MKVKSQCISLIHLHSTSNILQQIFLTGAKCIVRCIGKNRGRNTHCKKILHFILFPSLLPFTVREIFRYVRIPFNLSNKTATQKGSSWRFQFYPNLFGLRIVFSICLNWPLFIAACFTFQVDKSVG